MQWWLLPDTVHAALLPLTISAPSANCPPGSIITANQNRSSFQFWRRFQEIWNRLFSCFLLNNNHLYITCIHDIIHIFSYFFFHYIHIIYLSMFFFLCNLKIRFNSPFKFVIFLTYMAKLKNFLKTSFFHEKKTYNPAVSCGTLKQSETSSSPDKRVADTKKGARNNENFIYGTKIMTNSSLISFSLSFQVLKSSLSKQIYMKKLLPLQRDMKPSVHL
mgnify:CR=1 FL=1